MTTKQLDNLLFAQGGKCFFCKEELLRGDASVEHLVAKANGGGNTNNDNCIACCKAVNSLLGSLPLKHKIEIILNQAGKFICPSRKSTPTPVKQIQKQVAPIKKVQKSAVATVKPAIAAIKTPQKPSAIAIDNLSIAVSNLKKRGNAKPKKLKTLKTTLVAIVNFKNFKETEVDKLISELQKAGKIVVEGEQVTYKL